MIVSTQIKSMPAQHGFSSTSRTACFFILCSFLYYSCHGFGTVSASTDSFDKRNVRIGSLQAANVQNDLRYEEYTTVTRTSDDITLITLTTAETHQSNGVENKISITANNRRRRTSLRDSAVNALIAIVAGIFLLIGTMALTYCMTKFIDYVSPFRHSYHNSGIGNYAYNGENQANHVDRGVLVKKANLWGLRLFERELILQDLFTKHSFFYDPKECVVNGCEIEMSTIVRKADTVTTDVSTGTDTDTENVLVDLDTEKVPVDLDTEKVSVDLDTEKVSVDLDTEKVLVDLASEKLSLDLASEKISVDLETEKVSVEIAKRESEVTVKDDVETEESGLTVQDDLNHDRVCCICFNEYDATKITRQEIKDPTSDKEHSSNPVPVNSGDKGIEGKVFRGSVCKHMLHASCCYEWMIRSKNDHCPYCRTMLFTAVQFRETAIKVLGDKKVDSLTLPLPK